MRKRSKILDTDAVHELQLKAVARYRPNWDALDPRSAEIAETIVRLTEEVGGRAKAAEIMGVGPTTLDNFRLGKTQPKFLEMNRLFDAAGVHIGYPRHAEVEASNASENMVMIPQFQITASAGPGLTPVHEAIHSYFSVDREWLRRFLPSWAGLNARLGILQGAGDSMHPTIDDGDMIMVVADPPEEAVKRGGVFVVLHHDDLRIKRLQHYPRTGDIDLISDNPRYATETVKRERVEFDLRILAQVFFAGGRLRG